MSQVVEALTKLDSSCQVTATSVNNLLQNLIRQHNDNNQIDMTTILVCIYRIIDAVLLLNDHLQNFLNVEFVFLNIKTTRNVVERCRQ